MKAPIILAASLFTASLFTASLVAALFATGGPASAKPTPVEAPPFASLAEIATGNSNPTAAQREQGYFQAPPASSYAGRLFPCRMQLRVFEKTQTARSCN